MNQMHKGRWETHLLRLSGFVFLAAAILGLGLFLWGSISPGWFKMLGRPVGFRPAGLAILVEGWITAMAFFAASEILALLRRIANKG